MNLKLKKKIENEKMYYLVSDSDKPDTFYEFYEYPNYRETPNIETICYKTVYQELINAYKKKDFSSNSFKSILFLLHGIIIDGNVIDISSSKELSALIDNIRYRDLYNVINSFRKKLSIEVLEYFKDKILDIDVRELSNDTQNFFQAFLTSINFEGNKKEIFREILFLSIINEYHRAYVKVYEKEQELTRFQNEYENDILELNE